jgi:hypothetical protein
VGRAQTQFPGPVNHVQARLTGGKLIQQLACPIGRIVVHYNTLDIDQQSEDFIYQKFDILSFIICWNDNCGLH